MVKAILRLALSPRRKQYRLGLLLTEKNGDFGAISVTARSIRCAQDRHFSERVLYHSLVQCEQVFGDIGCLPFTKSFRKIRL